MENIKVSIILPVYNVAPYLRECLESAINQSLKDIEIICINDGSTDNSLDILKEYAQNDNRIKIINKKNGGVSAARNAGLDNARGKYIAFLDGDDRLEPDGLETAFNEAEENNSDIVIFNYYDVGINNEKASPLLFWLKSFKNNPQIPYRQLSYLQYTCWNKLYKNEFISKYNIRFYTNIKYGEDGLFSLSTLAHNPKYSFLCHPVYNYRFYRAGSAMDDGAKVLNGDFQGLKRFCNDKTFKDSSAEFKKLVLEKYINCFCACYQSPRYKNNRFRYIDILKIHRFLTKNFAQDILDDIKSYKEFDKLVKDILSTKKLFFIFNERKNLSKHKVFQILGFKFKFRVNGKKKYRKFGENIKDNSVLIIEANNCHAEMTFGYAKYFKDLGYTVDIILNNNLRHDNPAACSTEDVYDRLIFLEPYQIKGFLSSNDYIPKYDFVLVNSYHLYYECSEDDAKSFDSVFPDRKMPKFAELFVEHHLDKINSNLLKENKIIQLADFKSKSINPVFVNPHYYKEIETHNKNKMTNFITVGANQMFRKNHAILVNSIEELIKKGITNFKVTIAGDSRFFEYPENIKEFLDIKGILPFKEMYNEIENADFLLPLLDPENEFHNRYISDGTSGSFQLIYGFIKPCIIAEKFAAPHYFNTENSIIYSKNQDFTGAMEQAIAMENNKYSYLCKNLKTTSEDIYKKSLANLSEMLDYHKNKTATGRVGSCETCRSAQETQLHQTSV